MSMQPAKYDPHYLAEVHSRTDLVRLRDDAASDNNVTMVSVFDRAIAIKDKEQAHG